MKIQVLKSITYLLGSLWTGDFTSPQTEGKLGNLQGNLWIKQGACHCWHVFRSYKKSFYNVRTLKSRLSLPTGPGHSPMTPLISGPRSQPLSAYYVLLGTISYPDDACEPQ